MINHFHQPRFRLSYRWNWSLPIPLLEPEWNAMYRINLEPRVTARNRKRSSSSGFPEIECREWRNRNLCPENANFVNPLLNSTIGG